MRPGGFLACDLVGVDLALGEEAAGIAVGDELDREGGVDREAQLQGREHQLGGGAWDDRFLRHRAEDEVRLMPPPPLGVDHQRSPLDLHAALVQPQEVLAEGLKALLAAGVEEAERLRREVLVAVGLAEAAGIGAADQRCQAPGADPLAVEVGENPIVGLLLQGAQRLDLRAREATVLLEADPGGKALPHLRRHLQRPAERAARRGGREPHGEVGLRAPGLAPLKHRRMFGQVLGESLGMAEARIERRQRPPRIEAGVESARDAKDLEVGLDRVGESLKALADLDLALLGEPRIALAGQLVNRPGVGRSPQDEVAPEEVVRRPHSKITSRPAGTSRTRPRRSGPAPVARRRQRRAVAIRSSRERPRPRGASALTATG